MRRSKLSKSLAYGLSSILLVTSLSFTDATETNVHAEETQKLQYSFGSEEVKGYTQITKDSIYSSETGVGFGTNEYLEEAAGWVDGVYYPRSVTTTSSDNTYISDGETYLGISSKVWTETESSGYGVYTYENTSTFNVDLDSADYTVTVELVNPTEESLAVYLEAEDITKCSDIIVEPGETSEQTFTACLVDGQLNLKFLAASSATQESDAVEQTIYVSNITLEKQVRSEGEKPTVFIASDSTVQTYDDYYAPQTGWGQVIYNFFEGASEVSEYDCEDCDYSQSQTYELPNVTIENRAIGGRSSKSFIEEGKLDDLLEDVKPGDYVFVQWAHNDATYSRPNRYVAVSDFEKYLQYYVDGVTQRGGTCILVTPIARRSYSEAEDGTVTFNSNFDAYRQVMLSMAEEQNIPIMDLTEATINLCNQFGAEGSKSLFLWADAGEYEGAYAGGVSDNTHLQYYGAYKFAQCLATLIKEYDNDTQISGLQALISDTQSYTEVPAKSTGLEVTSTGASSVTIQWDAQDDAELYYIYRAELEEGEDTDCVSFEDAEKYSVSTKTSYTDSNCEGGKTYVYSVAGFNEVGVGEKSVTISVTTKSATYQYDLCLDESNPTMEGWTQVTSTQAYDDSVGYGWITSPGNGRYRKDNGNEDSNDMTDDFCLGEGEFAVDLPNGDYEIKVTACDLMSGTSTIKASYTVEGNSIGTITTKQAAQSICATVKVTDGQLNLVVGGTNPYMNGLEITSLTAETMETPVTSEINGENLADRALVAINLSGDPGVGSNVDENGKEGTKVSSADSGIYLTWRLFEEDPDDVTFTLYKNDEVLVENLTVTNYLDEDGTTDDVYRVAGSSDEELLLSSSNVETWQDQYLELTLDVPEDQTMPDGSTCDYTANDMSVGDLDNDGKYELIVKWYPSNAKDNSQSGYTGTTILDAYDIDLNSGSLTKMWRIDLGINIRSGAHYTQFQVWDLDGDGYAELVCKTGDGTVDGKGTVIGDETADYRNSSGYILEGNEYLTVFDGRTGAALDTIDFEPARDTVESWGDSYGNRCDRFLSCVAYLDGTNPSVIFTRGYYERTAMAAYDYEEGKLVQRWKFDTETDGSEYESQGDHSIAVNDVDGDGRDEIVFGALVMDDDGTPLYNTGLGHGDAMHVSDLIPSNPGLEIFEVHENTGVDYQVEIHDAETGEILYGYYNGEDTGRGLTADIDPNYEGAEFWSSVEWNGIDGGLYSSLSTFENVVQISNNTPSVNFSIYWDGDLLSEMQDHTFNNIGDNYYPVSSNITDWDYENNESVTLFESSEILTNNGTKGTMGLVADIMGDWREEIISRTSDESNSKIRIYSTTIDTEYSIPCLMENHAYRIGIAWQNVAYNQPAHLDYLLSDGLKTAEVSAEEAATEQITLQWTPASDGTYGHEVTGYEIYRLNSDGTYEKIGTVDASDTENYEYVDSGLEQNTDYTYKVAGIVDGKTSYYSIPVTITTALDIQSVVPFEELTLVQDQEDLESMIPTTATVIDKDGNEVDGISIDFDLSEFSISNVGTDTVYGTINGYKEEIPLTIVVEENTVTGYEPLTDVYTLVGEEAELPTTVILNMKNGTTKEEEVTWDISDLDIQTVGEYRITGQTDSLNNIGLTIIVRENYIVSVEQPSAVEAIVGSTAIMPETVSATYVDGTVTALPVTWGSVDTSTAAVLTVEGYIDDYAEAVNIVVNVIEEPLIRFDFGISTSDVADGWTGVTVNPKGSTSVTGYEYSAEKGYGFTDIGEDTLSGSIEGRNEDYTYDGVLSPTVYTDFALPSGREFKVDVLNGIYDVEVVAGSYYKSSVVVSIEGSDNVTISNADGTYTIQKVENVEITDGQMNFVFGSGTYRMNAIMITPAETEELVLMTSLALSETQASLTVSETLALTYTYEPEDVTDCSVTWSSSDTDVVTVDETGLVTAVGEGDAVITCTAFDDSQLTAACEVSVKEIAVKKVKLNASSVKITQGDTYTLEAAITPADASNQTLTWSSSNTDAATVDENGIVTAVAKGKATITVKANNGKKAKAKVRVIEEPVKVSDIDLNLRSKAVKHGSTVSLTATIQPDNAANKEVTWTSSNTKVATVSEDGLVTAKRFGFAVITCRASDGGGAKASFLLFVW